MVTARFEYARAPRAESRVRVCWDRRRLRSIAGRRAFDVAQNEIGDVQCAWDGVAAQRDVNERAFGRVSFNAGVNARGWARWVIETTVRARGGEA